MSPIAHKSYEVRLTSPLPIAFILLWSSGYIGGAFGVRYGEPFTMTFYRFALAALVFLGVALAIKAEWPRRLAPYLHAAAVGLLLQALQFGGLYTGISQGVPAGQAALIVGLMPVFVVIGAYFCLGEQLSWSDLPGSILGVGGVAIVVASSFFGSEASMTGYGAVGLALLGITLGTLYQKRFLGGVNLWVGCFVQMLTASTVMLILGPGSGLDRQVWRLALMRMRVYSFGRCHERQSRVAKNRRSAFACAVVDVAGWRACDSTLGRAGNFAGLVQAALRVQKPGDSAPGREWDQMALCV